MDTDIICLSSNRARRVLTLKLAPRATIIVPLDQEGEYKKHNPQAEIRTHPMCLDTEEAKHQFVSELYPNFFLLADDITQVRRVWIPKDGTSPNITDTDLIYDIIQQCCYTARQAGRYLYGFSHHKAPKDYTPHRPIETKGVVPPWAFGINAGGKLNFVGCGGKAGHWISALNAHRHRKVWIDTRFCIHRVDTYSQGTEEDNERAWTEIRSAFGSNVVFKVKTIGRSRNAEPYELKFP